MAAALSNTGITFSGTVYQATSVSVKDVRESLDVTSLNDIQKQYQASPLFGAAEATVDFVGYGPRAGATGAFSCPGVAGLGATVVSSSVTFNVNEIIKSQATIQFARAVV